MTTQYSSDIKPIKATNDVVPIDISDIQNIITAGVLDALGLPANQPGSTTWQLNGNSLIQIPNTTNLRETISLIVSNQVSDAINSMILPTYASHTSHIFEVLESIDSQIHDSSLFSNQLVENVFISLLNMYQQIDSLNTVSPDCPVIPCPMYDYTCAWAGARAYCANKPLSAVIGADCSVLCSPTDVGQVIFCA